MNFYDSRAHEILTESTWQRLDESTRVYLNEWDEVINIINESQHSLNFLMLNEAKLTPDQIQELFKSAEEIAKTSVNNRTAVGKTVDGVKLGADAIAKINAKINDLAQKAIQIRFGEGETLEQKLEGINSEAEKLKQKLYDSLGEYGGKAKKLADTVTQFAKDNPAKASLAVGLLTVCIAASAGAAGGVVAVEILY